MSKMLHFIMSKKFIPVAVVLTVMAVIIGFKSQGFNDNPKTKYARILKNVAIVLQNGHFSPKKINDDYSAQVLSKFLEDVDNDKTIFLNGDIKAFDKFKNVLDDEMSSGNIVSFFEIQKTYEARLKEVSLYIDKALAKPLDFTKDEQVQLDGDKNKYALTETDRYEQWRKRLKYSVLSRYADLLDDKAKNKGKKDFVVKADSTLEREAREAVKKQFNRYFTTKISRETKDFTFGVFANAYAEVMDPHSNYFPPADTREFREETSGSFFGIGAQLKEEDGKIKIASLVTGGPAWKEGRLKQNDEVIKVAQAGEPAVDVTGYSVADAVKLIRGSKKGSIVKLTVKGVDGAVRVIDIARDLVSLEDSFVKSAIVNEGDKKIGYIYLPGFYAPNETGNRSCAEDVRKELVKLKAENVNGVVMDLRFNGGGSLADVVKMVGLFIKDGPITQIKDGDGKIRVLNDDDPEVVFSGPLTVMINEFSASASEIFAAAIQDYKRGVVVGSTSSFGKGSVQRLVPLNPISNQFFKTDGETEDLGTVKLTLQLFYRINGGTTQLKGVESDVVFPDRYEFSKVREKYMQHYLPYSEIPKARYGTEFVVKDTAFKSFAIASNFTKIKSLTTQLEAESDKPVNLQLAKYNVDQKRVKEIVKQLDEALKLGKELVVTNTTADKLAADAPKDKIEKNERWLKTLKTDIYLAEAVKVITKI
jgi:carboxyl-terminal processing protease